MHKLLFSHYLASRYSTEEFTEAVIESKKRESNERRSKRRKLVKKVKNVKMYEQSCQDIPDTEMESQSFLHFDDLNPVVKIEIESDSSDIWEEFRCPDCNMTFDSGDLLACHMIAHKESYTYSCDVCPDKFRTVKSLRKHKKIHIKEESLFCGLCGHAGSHENYLKHHLRKHTHPFSCEKCGESFHLKRQLTRHMATHVDKTFKCNMCDKEYDVCRNLLLHKRQCHPEHKCVTCGRLFPSRSILLLHQPSHSSEKHFSCDKCEATFRYKQYLYTHKKNVHPDSLQILMNKDEVGRNVNQCEICGKTFPYKNTLRAHVNTHTRAKSYACDVCGKTFGNRDHLKYHCKIHTGDRSFTCDVCGKAFIKSWDLKQHQRTHTGERPYECGVCGKAFTQRSTLTIHKRLHTGERPYKCDVCDQEFVCKALLTVHQKTHKKCTAAENM